MQPTKLPTTILLLLVICCGHGASFYMIRPLFHDNYHYNPAISPFPGSASSLLRGLSVAKGKPSADLPDSLPSSSKRQDFPVLSNEWRWPSRYPY